MWHYHSRKENSFLPVECCRGGQRMQTRNRCFRKVFKPNNSRKVFKQLLPRFCFDTAIVEIMNPVKQFQESPLCGWPEENSSSCQKWTWVLFSVLAPISLGWTKGDLGGGNLQQKESSRWHQHVLCAQQQLLERVPTSGRRGSKGEKNYPSLSIISKVSLISWICILKTRAQVETNQQMTLSGIKVGWIYHFLLLQCQQSRSAPLPRSDGP